jgi:hypothetical protein
MNAAMIVPQRRNSKHIPIAYQINMAFAQFDLLGFSVELNPQTKSITNPTTGIKEIRSVTTQSFVVRIGLSVVGAFAVIVDIGNRFRFIRKLVI